MDSEIQNPDIQRSRNADEENSGLWTPGLVTNGIRIDKLTACDVSGGRILGGRGSCKPSLKKTNSFLRSFLMPIPTSPILCFDFQPPPQFRNGAIHNWLFWQCAKKRAVNPCIPSFVGDRNGELFRTHGPTHTEVSLAGPDSAALLFGVQRRKVSTENNLARHFLIYRNFSIGYSGSGSLGGGATVRRSFRQQPDYGLTLGATRDLVPPCRRSPSSISRMASAAAAASFRIRSAAARAPGKSLFFS